MTSRERVTRCLTFNTPDRVPRELWALPWFTTRHPDVMREMNERFPGDFGGAAWVHRPSTRAKGDQWQPGTSIDEWGCERFNIHDGVIGEIKNPMLTDLADYDRLIQPPWETLPENFDAARDTVNRGLGEPGGHDKYIKCHGCHNPWERYQYLRGTEEAMCDMTDPANPLLRAALAKIHGFFMKQAEFWASTDVDALNIMDDWGAQSQLLIPPSAWRELFKPLYRDLCDLARANNKHVFMHSDGFIEEIYPDLIEIGVTALNSQLFCMDIERLAAYKGKITFWGELDRQHTLASGDPSEIRRAVRRVVDALHDPRGGVIAQFELGPGAHPDAGFHAFQAWDEV